MSRKKTTYHAVYGDTKILKKYCPYCHGESFIIDNKYSCCDSDVLENKATKKYRVEVMAIIRRKQPLPKNKKKILENQNYVCVYCGKDFDRFLWSKKSLKYIKTTINWDHFVPYSYNNVCKDDNFVAACSVCNRIKSNKIFDTLEMAREYIYRKLSKKYSEFHPENFKNDDSEKA